MGVRLKELSLMMLLGTVHYWVNSAVDYRTAERVLRICSLLQTVRLLGVTLSSQATHQTTADSKTVKSKPQRSSDTPNYGRQ